MVKKMTESKQLTIEDLLMGDIDKIEQERKKIEDIWKQVKPEQMSSDSWAVYRYFRDNALKGIHIQMSAKGLSKVLDLSERALREASEEISRFTDLAFIGDDKGYRIAKNEEEYNVYCEMRKARTKSSIIKTAHVLGGTAWLHQVLNEIESEVTHKPNSKQQRMPLTKGTIEEVRKYFDDYNKK